MPIESPRWPFCAVTNCNTRVSSIPICADDLRYLPEDLRAELREAVRASAAGAGRTGRELVGRCVSAISSRRNVKHEG